MSMMEGRIRGGGVRGAERGSYFVTHHDELGHACRRSTLTERVPCDEHERASEERMDAGGRTGCDYESELAVV